MLSEVKEHLPDLAECLVWFATTQPDEWLCEEGRELFSKLEATSFDKGVLEKSRKVAVIPIDVEWNDVGSFIALEELGEADDNGNVLFGNAVQIDSQSSIIYAGKRLIAALGLKDMVVVDTHDATLICPKDRCQDVRKVVGVLKKKGAEECLIHRVSERPWGKFTVLEKGPGYKIKLVEVKPGARLSNQLHHHRSEHWIVVSGTAKVTREGREEIIHQNESTFIPPSTLHRLENPGIIPLKIIEVQNGEYLEEDDIIRVSDDYKREKK
jgi:mannose-1-phosphate guanylyltransferase/mannose-6-phosphate isomerase